MLYCLINIYIYIYIWESFRYDNGRCLLERPEAEKVFYKSCRIPEGLGPVPLIAVKEAKRNEYHVRWGPRFGFSPHKSEGSDRIGISPSRSDPIPMRSDPIPIRYRSDVIPIRFDIDPRCACTWMSDVASEVLEPVPFGHKSCPRGGRPCGSDLHPKLPEM